MMLTCLDQSRYNTLKKNAMFDQKITYKIFTSESKSKFDFVLTTCNIHVCTCYLCTKNYINKM